jgi:hypothetical protein
VKKVIVHTVISKKDGFRLLAITCPYCGERHIHGGGPIGDDVQKWGGSRYCHCWKPEHIGKLYALVVPHSVKHVECRRY